VPDGSKAVATRYRVTAPLVLAKDKKNLVHHHYEGELIEWLSDEQRDRWLADNLVEEITEHQVDAINLAEARRQKQADNAEAERVRQCVEALDDLDLPLSKGRPAVRAALEERGLRFSNETVGAALKARRDLSRTPGMPAHPRVSQELATP
jgi:hypothetical protein